MASIAGPPIESALAQRLLTDLLGLSALVASADVEQTLRRVAELSARHIADDDLQIGVSLVVDGHVETGAWLGDAVCRIDNAQYESDDDGPCVEAIHTGEIHEVRDMLRDRRWPHFARTAVDNGVHSSLSLPLVAHGQTLGAINVYAPHPEAFDQRSRTVGTTLSDHGALALATARSFAQARQAAVTLQLLADAAATATASQDPEALCDHLLGHLLHGDTHNDDIALLALTLTPLP